MKRKFLLIGVTSIMIVLNACNQPAQKQDSKEVAEERNEEKIETNKVEKGADFLVDAYDNGMFEIQAATLAETKATSPEVKSLASMIKKDHVKANSEISTLATQKSITIPGNMSNDMQKEYEKLSKLNGKDFDKEYMDITVEGHEKGVKEFEKISMDATDPDIKKFAANILPSLRHHYEEAQKIKDQVDKT